MSGKITKGELTSGLKAEIESKATNQKVGDLEVEASRIDDELVAHKADTVQQTNEGQTEMPHGLPKCKLNAMEFPTINDDETKGYSVGSRWVNISGNSKQEFVCVDATSGSALWKATVGKTDVKLYFYNEGMQEVTWSNGYSAGGGSQSKNADHMLLTVSASSERAYVTDVLIDLKPISKLCVEWSSVGQVVIGALNVSTDKNGDLTTYDARSSKSPFNSGSRLVNELDVSNLSGQYYIRVHAFNNSNENNTSLKIFKVWGLI